MRLKLLRAFFNCGDGQIIEFALIRARLNKNESRVMHLMMDECMTQEEVAEELHYSTRRVQQIWVSAADKLLAIPWVISFAKSLS